jgi:hypothetical protein
MLGYVEIETQEDLEALLQLNARFHDGTLKNCIVVNHRPPVHGPQRKVDLPSRPTKTLAG